MITATIIHGLELFNQFMTSKPSSSVTYVEKSVKGIRLPNATICIELEDNLNFPNMSNTITPHRNGNKIIRFLDFFLSAVYGGGLTYNITDGDIKKIILGIYALGRLGGSTNTYKLIQIHYGFHQRCL